MMVASVDGRSIVDGTSQPLTGALDQILMQRLRANADAILVGAATVSAEKYAGPLLAERELLPPDASTGRFPSREPRVFVIGRDMPNTRTSRALSLPCSYWLNVEFGPMGAGRTTPAKTPPMSLRESLQFLRHTARIEHVVCEGGPTLLTYLIAERALDELFLTISPRIVARGDSHIVRTLDGARGTSLRLIDHLIEGDFVFLRYCLSLS
ncbi:MAG: dihydrofolate reductase family protein [Thermoleophilum sp.]|nr:dihydrofolate reductase family protein [Thermoleophilum sp.]